MDREEEKNGGEKKAPRSEEAVGRNWPRGKGPSSEEMEKEHGKGGYGAA